jgi:hypothetical protein
MPFLTREMRLAFDRDRKGGGLSAKPSSCAVQFIGTNWSDRQTHTILQNSPIYRST